MPEPTPPPQILAQRPLGTSGPLLSLLGLGTVKWGRNQNVKYPAFSLPPDSVLHALLDTAEAAGVNFLDTAPAYGIAEERVGKILEERPGHPFLVTTKTGEDFVDGESSYDFSVSHTEISLQRSLARLKVSTLDAVQVHCGPDDVHTLTQTPVLETLLRWQAKGAIGRVGVSTMSVEGGLLAAELADFLMVPFSVGYQAHLPVIQKAASLGKGILLKRALFSGPSIEEGRSLADHLHAALTLPGLTSIVAGTIQVCHLQQNVDGVLAYQ